MKPKTDLINEVRRYAKNTPEGAVEKFLSRVDPDYRAAFDARGIASQLLALMKLSDEKPVQLIFRRRDDGSIECSVLAFDHPFEFSIICGVMAGTGFGIKSSNAFTLPRMRSPSLKRPVNRRQLIERPRDPMSDPVILDHFIGELIGPLTDFREWVSVFAPAVEETIALLNQELEESTNRAKRMVNERVTRWLNSRRRQDAGRSPIVRLEADVEQLPAATRLRLQAPDTPAFLYALSTALSLHGLQIEKTRARTLEGKAVNEIDVVDGAGKPLEGAEVVRQLKSSVLLTLQFSYFLDRAPDPFSALQRFEELARQVVQSGGRPSPRAARESGAVESRAVEGPPPIAPKLPEVDREGSPGVPGEGEKGDRGERGDWLELLANPLTMADLAKILGASDFLWEDFIRWNADALLPLLQRRLRGEQICPLIGTLPRRLEDSLVGAKHFDEQRKKLNEFKDHELFLIDLDHILTDQSPDAAFQILSQRLVFLAENLIGVASRLVYGELVRLYGRPRDEKKRDTDYAIFGLGKLGGVALGYASDIELLFLYGEEGDTGGGSRGSLKNAEFFAIMAKETCDYIQAKREGIFQVDLRLRPYGKNGPLASSRRDFATYYGGKGDAHPFERLALGRLRWISGDPGLGFEIERVRDEILYEGPTLDLGAIWEISGKMRQQHCPAGQKNSKHGDGALADLEQMVQLLQVANARAAPQLRTPRLIDAMDALHRAGIFSAKEFEQVMCAYQFFRRLINAQRMLRGSAKDLVLPVEGSDELVHLARRMGYASDDPGAELLGEFGEHTEAVRKLMKKRFGSEMKNRRSGDRRG